MNDIEINLFRPVDGYHLYQAIKLLSSSGGRRNDNIAIRLIELYAITREEGDIIYLTALRSFVDYMIHHKEKDMPKITITSDAGIRASWYVGTTKDHDSLEFA